MRYSRHVPVPVLEVVPEVHDEVDDDAVWRPERDGSAF